MSAMSHKQVELFGGSEPANDSEQTQSPAKSTIHNGDVLEVLRDFPDNTFHAVLSDPPYGLAFMGKRWDYDLPSVEALAEILRVLRPGGYALFFGGTRTFHRLAVRLEDVGFELRDTLCWLYGTGFPKSMDVRKQVLGAVESAMRAKGVTGPIRWT